MLLIAAACAGFLIAVLWMDLIFDTQVLRHRREEELPESVVDSISAYYHRATTTSRPPWLLAASAVLAAVPILLALVRTVPNAVALGNRVGTPSEQSRLARSICRDHLLCLVFMSAFLALWVAVAA